MFLLQGDRGPKGVQGEKGTKGQEGPIGQQVGSRCSHFRLNFYILRLLDILVTGYTALT